MAMSSRSIVVAVLGCVLPLFWVATSTAQDRVEFTTQFGSVQELVEFTQFGSVQELEVGWIEDAMSVRHSAPIVNPGRCPVTAAGYATNPADRGHSLFHTVLLSAFLNRKEVSLGISGCIFSKPRVIGVKIR